MKKILQIILNNKWKLLVVILVVGGGIYYFYNNKTEGVSEKQFKTEVVERGDLIVAVDGSGQIQAESQVDLKPQIAGDGLDIEEILVENNQLVKKGDVIAVLDSSDTMEKIRDAQLSLLSAQIQYEETAKEFDNQTSEESWKRQLAQNTVNQRKNVLTDAYQDLADYKIEAPFSGIITGLHFEAGDSISRDEILASVITEKLQAEISLNEIDAVKVKKGSSAVLIFDAIGEEEFEGEVSKIDTIGSVNSGVVSYDVVISFETSSELLKPGMSVEVNIEIDKAENVLLISNSMINKKENGTEFVLVTSGKNENDLEAKITKKNIETGITDDIYTEVLSGLAEGDLIIAQTSTKQSVLKTQDSETKSIMPMGGGGGGDRSGSPRN